MAATKVLGCTQFSTKDNYANCRSLQAHFLGGTLTILVGGIVVVSLLVFTVALMIRHRVCANHAGHHDDTSEAGRSGSGCAGPGKGTSFDQSNSSGEVMMVVLPNGMLQKQKRAATGVETRPTSSQKPQILPKPKVNLEQLKTGMVSKKALPPYSPESERMPMYYTPSPLPRNLHKSGAGCKISTNRDLIKRASFSLPHYDSDFRNRRFSTGGTIVVQQGSKDSQDAVNQLCRKRSSSFDMSNMAATTCYSYARRLGVIWSKRSQSLHGMLVQCASTNSISTASSGNGEYPTQGGIHGYKKLSGTACTARSHTEQARDKGKRKMRGENGEELEESVV